MVCLFHFLSDYNTCDYELSYYGLGNSYCKYKYRYKYMCSSISVIYNIKDFVYSFEV